MGLHSKVLGMIELDLLGGLRLLLVPPVVVIINVLRMGEGAGAGSPIKIELGIIMVRSSKFMGHRLKGSVRGLELEERGQQGSWGLPALDGRVHALSSLVPWVVASLVIAGEPELLFVLLEPGLEFNDAPAFDLELGCSLDDIGGALCFLGGPLKDSFDSGFWFISVTEKYIN